MPIRPTTLTASAGEHFVAYFLSTRNYIAALTRGGSPSVDILASSIDGKRTLGIQVKTSNWAFRERKRKPETSHWEFDVGQKAVGNDDDRFIYALVCLKGPGQEYPLIFWVLPSDISKALGAGHSRNMFWISPTDEQKYEVNNWSLVTRVLDKA
jgi:hypothetical protein